METPQAKVSRWLQAARVHSGDAAALGEDGHCRLMLEDGAQCIVEVPSGSDSVFLYMPVFRLPENAGEALQATKLAMGLHTFGVATGGSAFSYDARSDHVVLTLARPLDAMDEVSFSELLGGFIDSGREASARLMQSMRDEGARQSTHALPGMIHLMRA